MTNKKYSFCVEKVYRAKVECDFDIDEIRKNNKKLANLSNDELLYNVAEAYGLFDENNGTKYVLDEEILRSIYNIDDNKVVYEK